MSKRFFLVVLLGWGLFGFVPKFAVSQEEPVSALPRLHSHNDYRQKRPLEEALDNGFLSVEADIFCRDDTILVGHDEHELRPERTLEAIYLAPLNERAKQFNGRIFPDADSFTLLIDVKTDADEAYHALQPLLAKYDAIITSYENGEKNKKAIDVILSGNRPFDLVLAEQKKRYVALDGRIRDLDSDLSTDFLPMISEAWGTQFSWKGIEEISDKDRAKLAEQVRNAHEKGRVLRYWASPDNEDSWEFQYKAGVDFINTDRPEAIRKFFSVPHGFPTEVLH